MNFHDTNAGKSNLLLPHASVLWDDANCDTLRRLWAEGLSCAAIAAKIEGATRNAIIGKAHRLNLPTRPTGFNNAKRTPSPPRAPRPPRKPAKRKPATKPSGRLAVWTRLEPTVPVIPTYLSKSPAWLPLPGTEPKTIMDLAAHDCRWPIGEDRPYTFCGCPQQAGSSYCATHAAMSAGEGTQSERSAIRTAKSMARAA